MVKMGDVQIQSSYIRQVEEVHIGKTFIMDKWNVVLTYEDRKISLPFFMGSGFEGSEPTLKNVLDSLISNYYLYYNSRDILDYAREVGIAEEDQEEIEKQWDDIEVQSKNLEFLLGEDGIEMLNEEIQAV